MHATILQKTSKTKKKTFNKIIKNYKKLLLVIIESHFVWFAVLSVRLIIIVLTIITTLFFF